MIARCGSGQDGFPERNGTVKKTFPLQSEGQKPARVVEQVKADVRKYLKRERRKELPEDMDFWDFDCRAGAREDDALPVHEKELVKAIDAAVESGHESIYLEILARAAKRTSKPKSGTAS